MSNWEIVRLSTIAKIKRGASPRPIDDPKFFAEEGRAWIRISDVTAVRKYLDKTTQYLSEIGEANSVKVNRGELIMSICATIGKPAILDIDACIHDGFVWFSELVENIDVQWLFYLLEYKRPEILNLNQTGTQGNLNTKIVKGFSITLPTDITEQKAIADVLITIDNVIENTEKIIAKRQRQKEGLMQDLFRYGLDESGNLRSEATHKFKDSPLGRIPEEWEISNLNNKELFSLITDGSHYSPEEVDNSSYQIATVENMLADNIDYEACKHISNKDFQSLKLNNCAPKQDDILFSKDGTIGRVLVYHKEKYNLVLLSSICIIRPVFSKMHPLFVKQYLSSFWLKKQLITLTSGSALRRIVLRDIKKIKILVPPLKEQNDISLLLNSIDYSIDAELKVLVKLKRNKSGLMNDLLTGKKRITKEIIKNYE